MLQSYEMDLSQAMVRVLVSGQDIKRILVTAFHGPNEALVEGEKNYTERFYPRFLPIDYTRNGSCVISENAL